MGYGFKPVIIIGESEFNYESIVNLYISHTHICTYTHICMRTHNNCCMKLNVFAMRSGCLQFFGMISDLDNLFLLSIAVGVHVVLLDRRYMCVVCRVFYYYFCYYHRSGLFLVERTYPRSLLLRICSSPG